jgi:hypothetical protein
VVLALQKWQDATKSPGQKGTMALTYQTGEEIQRGDRVTYGGNPGVIELVVEASTGQPEEDWLLETLGAGIMVAEPKVFGRVYLHAPHEEEDLRFVGRAA